MDTKKPFDTPEIKLVNESPCHFGDTFRVSARKDGLFLLDIMCTTPSGHQVNSRTMLTEPSLIKLKKLLENILENSSNRGDEESPK